MPTHITCVAIGGVDVWPDEVLALRTGTDERRRYVPEVTAQVVRVPRRSHVALGHYECGACGRTIDASDRHCRACGARLEGER